MKRILMTAVAVLAFGVAATNVKAAIDTSQVHVKKAIADTMSPEQLQAYKERLAERLAAGAFDRPSGGGSLVPGDTCVAATPEIGPLPYGPIADTTVGATDNFDLPADTTNPTCAAPSTCTGAGPAGSLPRGAIYTGTGTGPDRGFRIQVSANCNLALSMDSTSADMAIIVYEGQCSSSLADCVCVDDTGFGGALESVTLSATTGTTYFVVVDGYSTGGTPPGPSDTYTFLATGTGCTLVPVELQNFTID